MNKIAIIIHRTNNAVCQKLLDSLSKLEIPQGYDVEVMVFDNSASRANSYNEGMRQSNAKYKIYIDETGIIINTRLLINIMNLFNTDSSIGIVGLYGSEMPIEGDFTASKNRYGLYGNSTDGKTLTFLMRGRNPIWHQDVHCIDSAFVATSQDIEWDENENEVLLVAAQCCRFRLNGYHVSIPMQDIPWCVFARQSVYNAVIGSYALKIFFDRYLDIIQPLVSILITTYNQPVFFEQALKSALQQDYKNIEIIVGDDSTNTATKDLMEHYTKKYSYIRYYYHNGPLGGQGLENAKFVLNHAQGNFINYLFHDDLFMPKKISTMMRYLAKDLNEEIGMVTSARNMIDESGAVLGSINPWQPIEDTIIPGKEMSQKILISSQNYIGELTTVLMRKSLLKQQNGAYLMGCIYGVRDKANGDVATWLDIGRQKNCMFVKDVLSCFRRHSGQNTYNPLIIINSVIEWLNYITVMYNNNALTESELARYYDTWYLVHKNNIAKISNIASREKIDIRRKLQYCVSITKLLEAKKYEQVKKMSLDYINNNYEIIGR